MAERSYHLWRRYPTKPFRRWACTLKRADNAAGYEVVAHDPAVADAGFMHVVADGLHRPSHGMVRDGDSMSFELLRPGDPAHFDTAIRALPHVALSAEGRPT